MAEQRNVMSARDKFARQQIDDTLDAPVFDGRNRDFRIGRQRYTQL
jgi:hypothetical protein